jgi:hypothetical protein
MYTIFQMVKNEDPQVIRTWKYYPGTNTVILSLPYQLAKKYDIREHTNLLAVDTNTGILLKKLEVQ